MTLQDHGLVGFSHIGSKSSKCNFFLVGIMVYIIPVVFEVLEAENVEHADGLAIGLGGARSIDGRVDLLHNPDEESAVDALDKGVAHIDRLMLGESGGDRLARREYGLGGERNDELLGAHLQQLGAHLHHSLVGDLGRLEVVDVARLVLDVADVEDGGEEAHDVPDVLVAEREHLARRADVGELGGVVAALAHLLGARVGAPQVLVVARVRQPELAALLACQTGEHAVEDVIVALLLGLRDEARLLEQVLLDLGALDDALLVEVDVDVLAEAARVVVAYRLGVAERLEDRIGLEYLLLDPVVLAADGRQELEYELGALGLAGARLARDDHALVVLVAAHVVVGVVADGEYVRRQLADLLVAILLDLLARVDRQDLIRIHCHQYGARVCLREQPNQTFICFLETM